MCATAWWSAPNSILEIADANGGQGWVSRASIFDRGDCDSNASHGGNLSQLHRVSGALEPHEQHARHIGNHDLVETVGICLGRRERIPVHRPNKDVDVKEADALCCYPPSYRRGVCS
jgi:hypothetical protein